MLRFSHRSRGGIVYPTVLGLLGVELNRHDENLNSPTAKKMEEQLRLESAPLKGWEGLNRMFTKQEPNGISLELLSCVQLGLCSTIAGFIIGGIENTKFTVRQFKDQNQATMYQNTFEAQRSVQDKVSKEFFKGGLKMGTKCGSFLFCFSLLTTSLSTYRGKTSVADFAVAGLVTGAFFTLNRGLPGAVSGGTVGLVLGSLTGTVLVGTLWACGINLNEVRHWQYVQYQKRVEAEHKGYLKERERSGDEKERVAFYIIKPEEKEKGRIIDKLDELEITPEPVNVIVPELPPESMFRKEGKK